MYFSLPTKCFYEDVLSNTLHTILSELLRQSFQLVLIKHLAVQSRHFKFADILLVCSTAAQDRNNFFIKLQQINNKKVTKGRSSRKTSQNSQEDSYATVSLYWHRCFPVKFEKLLRAPPLTSPVAASENGIKNNKNETLSLQYKHKMRIRLKNTLNHKIQGSWISHVWRAYMCNAWLTIH